MTAGWRIWVLAGPLVALVGCGGGPPLPPTPMLVEDAYQWNQRAESAFRRGDLDGALEASQRALTLYRSLEDTDGVARELANLSTIHLARGETDAAVTVLAPVLVEGGAPFQARHRAEAAYRIAAIEAARRPTAAGDWLDRAERHCGADCDALGRILNLRARLQLDQQRLDAAQAFAQRALALHDKRGDRQEHANSLRLLGDIALAGRRPAEAREHYRRALDIDKDEAVPRKIFADLIGIGQSLAAEGRRAEAIVFFRRARAVADAAGDTAGVAEAERRLANDPR